MGSNRRVAPRQAWRPWANWRGQPAVRRSGAVDGTYRRTVARPTASIRSMKYRVQTLLSLIRQRGVANPLCPLIRGCGFRGGLSRQHYRSRPPARGRCPPKNGSDQAIGRSRGGLTTKVHACVDALGNPIRLILTAGQVADITQGVALVEDIPTEAVIADKGYDSDALVQAIEATGAQAIIPPRSNRNSPRKIDWHRYKARNLVERFFNRLKQFRRLAMRYEKLASMVLRVLRIVQSL